MVGEEMNAYELAEKLNDAVNKNEKHLTLDIEAMLMLRQQANRIKLLEKTIKDIDEWASSGSVTKCSYIHWSKNPKSVKLMQEIFEGK